MGITKKVFVTADTHFGHVNILRYTQRPFKNIEEMDGELISRWNNRVGKDDTVYFLGDFAFASAERIIEILGKLNGNLHFIAGNHDNTKQFISAMEKEATHGWPTKFIKFENSIAEIKHDGQLFILCHYPMESWNRSFHGSIHLHGHSHGSSRAVERRFDVGVDVYGGPVELTGDLRYLKEAKGWN